MRRVSRAPQNMKYKVEFMSQNLSINTNVVECCHEFGTRLPSPTSAPRTYIRHAQWCASRHDLFFIFLHLRCCVYVPQARMARRCPAVGVPCIDVRLPGQVRLARRRDADACRPAAPLQRRVRVHTYFFLKNISQRTYLHTAGRPTDAYRHCQMSHGSIFGNFSEHADGERRGARSNRRGVPERSRRDTSLATFRSTMSPRRSPSACSEKKKKKKVCPCEAAAGRELPATQRAIRHRLCHAYPD